MVLNVNIFYFNYNCMNVLNEYELNHFTVKMVE